jgi:peptide/nickel transport system substrate-binding protein
LGKTGLNLSGPVSRQGFDNFFRFDPYDDNKLAGRLVESWGFDDTNTIFTMKLRSGVKWHDGRPFTSADALYTLQSVLEPPEGYTAGNRVWMAPVVKGFRVVDPLTVVVELKQPSASFLNRMTDYNLFAIPAHVDLDTLSKRMIGTGPFKFKSFERDIATELTKHTEYWEKDPQGRQLPFLDGLKYWSFTDRTLAGSALRTGRIKGLDIHQTPIVEVIAEQLARDLPGVTLDLFVQGHFGPFFKNQAPFNDRRVLEAIDLWVDRKTFIDVGYQGRGSWYDASVLPVEQGGKWGLPPEEIMSRPGYRQVDSTGKVLTSPEEAKAKRSELRKDPRDRERAKELLAAAGIRQGQVSFEVPTQIFEVPRGGPVFVAQMKELFGTTWTMKSYASSAEFSRDIIQGRFTVSFSAHTGYGIDEPSVTLSGWLQSGTTGPHVAGWDYQEPGLARIQQLFAEQEVTLDPVKRREVIWDLQRAILDWRGRIVTSNAEGFGAWWPEVKDIPLALTAFSNVWQYERVWLAR